MARHFDDWIKAYCDMLDGKTEAPRRFLYWTAVSCLAGALTRRVLIDEITYRFYPNFYVLLVSPQGAVKKTSTIDLGIELLRDLATSTPHVILGPSITTVEGLCKFLADTHQDIVSLDEDDDEARKESDTDEPPAVQCAATIAIGEFGTFYGSDDKDLINILIDLFDCRNVPLWKHTKTQGDDYITNPFVNIIAGATPQFLQDELKQQHGGWGLSSRIVFIYASKKERSIYRPSKVMNSKDFVESRRHLLSDLKEIAKLKGKFSFTPEADEYAEQHYNRTDIHIKQYVAQEGYNERVSDFMARKQVHVHKLAMILSAARRDDLVIYIDDIKEAAAQIDEVEKDIPLIFNKKLSASPAAETEQALIKKIIGLLVNGPATRSNVITMASQFVDSPTATRLIESAIARKVLSQEVRLGGISWLKNGHAPED